MPAGVGCLVALIALPIALFAAFVALLRTLLRPGRRIPAARGVPPRPGAGRSPGADVDLLDFVRKMALDDAFDVEDAHSAGLPVGRDVTVEGLIQGGLARGFIERRGDVYAVTSLGRAAAAGHGL